MFFSMTSTRQGQAVLVRTLTTLQPTIRVLRELGWMDQSGVLSMPELESSP
jgi:hypothetical protein